MSSVTQTDKEASRGPGRPRCEFVRRRILDSAAELLENTGFAEITVDAIAERAGASKATVYRWWPNKAAVLIEAFRESVASELPFPESGSLSEDVRLQLVQFARMLRGRRGRAFASFIAAAQSDPEVAEAFRTIWIGPRRAEAKEALRRHVASGELPGEVSLDLVIELLYAPLYYRLLTGYGPVTEEYAESVGQIVLAGFTKTAKG